MADDVNVLQIRGTLTEDPKSYNDNKNPAYLAVKTIHSFRKPDGTDGEHVVNHTVKCWGSMAALAMTLRSGDRVEIRGYYRVEGRDVGEGEGARTYFDHYCVVDEADGCTLSRL